MFFKRAVFFLAISRVLLFSIFSQEDGIMPPDEPLPFINNQGLVADEGQSGTEDSVLYLEEEEARELTLYEKTLMKDIETADFYELTAWCRALDLSDTGSLSSLQNRLLRYYKVEKNNQSKGTKAGTLISIESASKTDYFTIEETEEDIIIFSGNVILSMEEVSAGRSHRIEADKVIFNKSDNTISASGDISYELNDSKGTESFTGESMIFNVTSWNGVIYKGLSYKEETVDSVSITYYYKADEIKKAGSDIIILNRGIISTQDDENPYFQIKAQKIMVLGPAEWGIIQGFLYIGHVPVFYIPFYYKPGNDLFFNPAIGVNSREGSFIQTTSYLIGNKQSEEEVNLLDLGLSEAGDYSVQRKGLFNYKISEKESEDKNDDYLKYMADYYSKLGAFTGFEGSFSEFSFVEELSFHQSIAVSRDIDDNNDIYFPIISDDKTGDDSLVLFENNWNSSVLFGHVVPFRWGTSLDLDLENWSFTAEMYSDPSYQSDFYDRKENFDWLNYLLSDETDTEETESDISSINWQLNGDITPDVQSLNPWISSISLNPVEGDFYWKSKENESEDISDYSPEKSFFVPESFRFPYFTFSWSGDLINNSTTSTSSDEDEAGNEINPREPWYTSTEEIEDENKREKSQDNDYDNVKTGEILKNDVNSANDSVTQSLKYSIKSINYFDDTFKYEEWTSPDSIDYSLEEGKIMSSNDLSLKYNLALVDSAVNISDELRYEFNYVAPYSLDGTQEELSDEEILANLNLQKMELMNLFNTTVKFLTPFKDWNSSQIIYTQNTVLMERALDDESDETIPDFIYNTIEWDEESFSKHETGFNLVYSPDIVTLGFNYSYQLPPLDESHTFQPSAELNLFDEQIYQKVSQQIVYEADEWEFSPLNYQSDLNAFDENLQMEQTINYDMEEFRFNDITHELGLWPLGFSLIYAYTAPYSWNKSTYSWESGDDDFIPTKMVFSFDQDFETGKVWYNRMELKTGLNVDWSINLNQISDNTLDFRYSNDIDINEFLDLKLEIRSENSNMYLYVDQWKDELGIIRDVSFWEDLLKSFNFFSPNQRDRYDSNFNLKDISLQAVHNLKDWDLTLDYSGFPAYQDNEMIWDWTFSVFIKWNPIQKIQMKSIWDEEEINIETG